MRVHTLSSAITFYCKFVLSGVLALMLALTAFSVAALLLRNPPAWVFAAVLPPLCAIMLRAIVTMARWKRVRVDADTLYLSSYLREVRLPLSQLARVEESRWFQPRSIVLHLAAPTPFGIAVSFRPGIMPLFWRPHPVLEELRIIAAAGRAEAPQLARIAAGDRRRAWVAVGLFAVFFCALLVLVQALLAHSSAYRLGLQALDRDPAVRQALGTPLQPGLMIGGVLSGTRNNGAANLHFALSGPRGQGQANVQAFARAGSGWRLAHVWLQLPSGASIEVVAAEAAPGAAPGENRSE